MKKGVFFLLFFSLAFSLRADVSGDSDIPEVEQPKIDESEIQFPKIVQPEVDTPKTKVPNIKQSEIDQPEIDQPDEKPPAVKTPKIKTPEIHMPPIEQPNIKEEEAKAKKKYSYRLEPGAGKGIHWYTNYEESIKRAKEKNLPLFLLFSGTDWCPWCKKLEKNILEKPEFYEGITDKYVFCLIEFPMKKSVDPDKLAYNKSLMQEYEVIGFPTIAIVDVDKGLITQVGYLAISPEEYREYILEVTDTFYSSDDALKDPTSLSDIQWERLSMNAKQLGSPYFQKKLEEKGIKSCPSPYFLLEKYEKTIVAKGVDSKEAKILKERIKEIDPNNIYKSHLKIAHLEFLYLSKQTKIPSRKVVAPLVDYIAKCGDKTPELWKVHFLIAHFLFSKNEKKDALIHAKLSFKLAPEKIRKELAETIGSFRDK